MRKVTVNVEMQVTVVVDEGIEITDVVGALECTLQDSMTAADMVDFEILRHEVIDSK